MTCDGKRLREAMRGGDPDAFAGLWDAYGGRVLGFAVHLTGDRGAAEDLVQDTFVAALRGRRSYRGDGSPLSWLLGIAARRWRDTKRLHCNRFEIAAQGDPTPSEAAAPQQADDVLAIALAQELSRLPDEQREAFLLVVSQGLSYREASTATGACVGTLKWRVHRAMRQLRQTLFPEEV